MQTDPSEWRALRVAYLQGEMKSLYWHIRNTSRVRQGAFRRSIYRRIARLKDDLEGLGVSHREVLDMIACYRSKVCLPGCSVCGSSERYLAY